MNADTFTITFAIYTVICFVCVAPRFVLMPRLVADRYASASFAVMGMYGANLAVLILCLDHEWKSAIVTAFIGPLIALWLSLSISGISSLVSKAWPK